MLQLYNMPLRHFLILLGICTLAAGAYGHHHRRPTTRETTSTPSRTNASPSSTKVTSSSRPTSITLRVSSTKSSSSVKSTILTTSTTPSTTTTHAPGTVIVPLYTHPTPSTAWDPLFTSLATYPNVTFQVIVNPADGPGPANSYPDNNYLAAIPKLREYTNAVPLCYVHTSWTERAIADVLTDLETCHYWRTYTAADIHMSGIFFDEATATYNADTFVYMTNITTYARSLLGPGNDLIVFNPGTTVAPEWYNLADYIVAFEATYAAYSSAVITAISAAQRAQSLFLIHGFTGTAVTQESLLGDIIAAGIGGLEITTVSGYTAWSSLWAQFCSAMALT